MQMHERLHERQDSPCEAYQHDMWCINPGTGPKASTKSNQKAQDVPKPQHWTIAEPC